MRNAQIQILNKGDDTNRTGDSFWVGQIVSASFTPVFGDTDAAGTLKIQCSNDIPVGQPTLFVPSAGSWDDIPNATSAITAGKGPAIVIGSMCFAYIRAVYTSSNAGATTIKVNMNCSGV